MTNQRLLCIGLLTLLALPVVAAEDASGKWNTSIKTPQGDLPIVIELSVDGDSLTGTLSNSFMPKIPIQNGTVMGNELSFTLMLLSATIVYDGVLDGDTLTLTHKVVEQRDTNGGQSFGGVLMMAPVLTATRAD